MNIKLIVTIMIMLTGFFFMYLSAYVWVDRFALMMSAATTYFLIKIADGFFAADGGGYGYN